MVRKRERPRNDEDDDCEVKAYKLSHTVKRKRRSIDKSSYFRGVSKCTKDGRWQTRIRVGNAVKYLLRFQTEEIAAQCYDAAFIAYFGVISLKLINYCNSSDTTRFEPPEELSLGTLFADDGGKGLST